MRVKTSNESFCSVKSIRSFGPFAHYCRTDNPTLSASVRNLTAYALGTTDSALHTFLPISVKLRGLPVDPSQLLPSFTPTAVSNLHTAIQLLAVRCRYLHLVHCPGSIRNSANAALRDGCIDTFIEEYVIFTSIRLSTLQSMRA